MGGITAKFNFPALQLFSFLFILFILLVIAPPEKFGSSVIYVSIFFFLLALLSSMIRVHSVGIGKKSIRLSLEYLRLSPKRSDVPSLVISGIALGIASILFTMGLSFLLYLAGLLDTEPVLEKVSSLPAIALLAAFTLAPLGEEAFFRGFLFRYADEALSSRFRQLSKSSWLLSAVATSLIFSLLHATYGSFSELLVAFMVGMVLACSVKKTGSLLPAIAAHAIFNLASVISVVFF
jgi:membrane protease YdiL (CAAX protease family)